MQRDRILLPVWEFALCSSLRSCVWQLPITTLPSMAIVWGQNLGKTTLARRYMLLYDDKQRPVRCWAQLDAHSTAASTMDLVSRFCRAGVAFTGKLNLDNPSDVTRLVVVPLRNAMRNGTEEERTLTATSFQYFMRWLLSQLERKLDVLRGMLRNADGKNPFVW